MALKLFEVKIVLCNFKGGPGKSTIALNLALHLGDEWAILTNDRLSAIRGVLPESRFRIIERHEDFPKVDESWKLIYDFAGDLDDRQARAIREADRVIIPTVNEFKVLDGTLQTLEEVSKMNQRVIVIANRLGLLDKADRELESIEKVVRKHFGFPVLPLKQSRLFTLPEEKKVSAKAIADAAILHRMPYQKALGQLEAIVEELKL